MKRINLRILFRFGVIFSLAIALFLLKPILNPPQTQAAPQETNVDVFTGQIIPAFIASEYDPTEAFKMLAGGTVYVFAYDTWGSSSMVVGNIAIKTQIRADGTFQAMGLPHAAKYGVYFPYDEKGPTEGRKIALLQYDPAICSSSYNCDPDNPAPPPESLACSAFMCGSDTMQAVPFRWPKYDSIHPEDPALSDNILDIFSYQQKDYPSDVAAAIHDQLGNVVNLNNVIHGVAQGGKQVFITSSNKLDVENHVNVFPVIPTSVLRFKVNTHTAINNTPFTGGIFNSPVEVTAVRIALDNATGGPVQNYPLNNIDMTYIYQAGPSITGKTTADGDFMVYAPPGIYTLEYHSNENYFGFVYRHINPYTNPPLAGWSTWSNPIIQPYVYCPGGTPTLDQRIFYLYLFYKPLYIWGTVTRSVSVTTATSENLTVSLIPAPIGVGVFIDGGNRAFEGLPNFHDPTGVYPNNPGECDQSPNGYTHVLSPKGLYLFRLQGTPAGQMGTIKLQVPPPSGTTTPVIETDLRVCGPDPDTDPQICEPQEQQFYYASGIVPIHFSLMAKQNHGLKLRVLDASGNPVVGAKITIISKSNFNADVWANKKEGFPRTNMKGEIIIPFAAFLAKNLGGGVSPVGVPSELGIANESLTDDYMAVASISDEYSGTAEITHQNIQQLNTTVSERQDLVISNTDGAIDSDLTLLKIITPKEVLTQPKTGSMIWLAQKLRLTPPQVYAQIPAENRLTVCGDTAGVENGAGYLRLNGSFRNTVTENVVLAKAVSQADQSNAQTFYIQGTEHNTDAIWKDPNPNKDNLLRKEAFIYNKNNGNYTLFLPCLTGHWKITFFSGDRVDNIMDPATYNLASGMTGSIRSKVDQTLPGAFMELMMATVAHGTPQGKSVTTVGEYIGERWVWPHVVGNEHQSREFDVWIRSLGTDYEVVPPQIIAVLAQSCPPPLSLADISGEKFLGATACNLGYAFAQILPDMFNYLENTILTTKPLTETPAVVYLWNVMRKVTNVTFVVVLLVLGIMIILRTGSKDFNPVSLLPKIFKAVILANFSLLITQFFIDFNNILVHTTFSMINSAIMEQLQTSSQYQAAALSGVSAMGGALGTSLAASAGAAASLAFSIGSGIGPAILIFAVLFLIFLAVTLAFAVAAVIIQFIVRYALIWLCVILAPFNFLLSPLPFGKVFNQLWSKTFFAFVFMQTAVAIILGLGLALLVVFPTTGSTGLWSLGEILIAIAIVGIAIRSPAVLASLMGAGQGAQLMEGMTKGVQGISQGISQTFTPEEIGRRKGAAEMEYTSELAKRGGAKRKVLDEETGQMKEVGEVGRGKANLIRWGARARQWSGIPLFQKRGEFMAGRAKGVRGQMGEQETELQTHEAYRSEVAKSMFEEKSIYEIAAMHGISIGGARNIYTGLRSGAINNPNAEIKLLDKDSMARELQAPEAQAYLHARNLSDAKLEKAEENLKAIQANPAATGEQLEVAMAQLAEAKRNNDLLAKMVSKETKDGKDSYRLSGMDGKGTWQIGDLRQLSRLMWEDKGQKAAGFGADFIRQNVQFHDGYKMLPKGKSSIIPDTEVVRNWMGSKTYGQENVGGEYNRQMLTRLQHAAPGSYERMQTNADPTWTVQRKGTITRRVAQMMTHPQIAPLIPSKDMAGNVVPGGDFQQDTFSHIASMLQSKDFMYNPMTTTQERDALYKFLSRGHVDRSQAYSAQELQGMKKDYLNLINVLSASRRQAPFSEEEEEMIPGA